MVGEKGGGRSPSERRMLLLGVVVAASFLAYRAFSWGLVRGHDFYAVWEGASLAVDGSSPYQFERFIYFPSTLIFALPFAWLSFETARAAFLVVGLIAVVAGLVWSAKLGGHRVLSRPTVLLLVGAAIAQPVTILFASGNWNSVVFITTVAALDRAIRGEWTAAGVLIGVGAALKPSAAALLLLPALAGVPLAFGAAVAVLASLNLVAALVFPDPGGFVSTALPFVSEGTMSKVAPENLSLAGIAHYEGLPWPLVALLACAITAAFVALAYRRRADVIDCATALLVGSFLAGPAVWNHYLIFLVPWLMWRPLDSWRVAAIGLAAVSAIDLSWHLGTLVLLVVAAELVSVASARDVSAEPAPAHQ